MLCLFPAFQRFPLSIKNVEMDYSDYNLPPILLITGEDDGCLEDSKLLYDAVKRTNRTKIELNVSNADTDKVDHCFIVEAPYTDVSKQVFKCIYKFINE